MATYGGLSCCALGGRGGGTSCGGSWHSSKGIGSSSENCFGGRGGGGDSPPNALRGRDLISTVTGRVPGEVKVIDIMYHTSLILRPSARYQCSICVYCTEGLGNRLVPHMYTILRVWGPHRCVPY